MTELCPTAALGSVQTEHTELNPIGEPDALLSRIAHATEKTLQRTRILRIPGSEEEKVWCEGKRRESTCKAFRQSYSTESSALSRNVRSDLLTHKLPL